MLTYVKNKLCIILCTVVMALMTLAGALPTALAASAEGNVLSVDKAMNGEWEDTGDPFTYRFRDRYGVETEYKLVTDANSTSGKMYLYIDGQKALRKDVPVDPDTEYDLFGMLLNGRIFYFRAFYYDYTGTEEICVQEYDPDYSRSVYDDDVPIYDPVSKKLLATLDLNAKVSANGYLFNGNAAVSGKYSYSEIKFNIDENGNISSEIPGPEITGVESDVGKVTLSFQNVSVKKRLGGYDVFDEFAVSYRKKGDSVFTAGPQPQKNTVTVTGLEKGAEYTVRITTAVTIDGIKYALGYTDTDITVPEQHLKEGWNTVNGQKKYVIDGKQVSNEIVKINDKNYCFDKTGTLCSQEYYTINDNMYYINEDGTVAADRWVKTDHKNMDYAYAGSEGIVTQYQILQSYSDWELHKNGNGAKISDISREDPNRIYDKLSMNSSVHAADNSFIMLNGRIYLFNGRYTTLELVRPNKAAGITGALFDAASGDCLGKFKFTTSKTLSSAKTYLYNGTLTMTDTGVKYKIGSDGNFVEQKLPAPTKLTAESSANAIVITWNKVKAADSYNVYIYDSSKKEYKLYSNVKDTTCTISGLKKSTAYKIRVAAVSDILSKKVEQEPGDITVKTAAKTLNGLITKGSNKYYYRKGFQVKDEVVKVSGKYYGFDSTGKMIKNKTCKVGGETYQFTKSGAAVTDQWNYYKTSSKATYIGKDGKYTTYDLSESSVKINGKSATYLDFKHLGTGTKTVRLGKLYYTLDISKSCVIIASYTERKFDVYDVATGKVVDTLVEGTYLGDWSYTSLDSFLSEISILNNGTAFSAKNNMIYKFKGHEIQSKTKTSCPLVICKASTSLNYVDGCDLDLSFYNNSSKTIKYLTLNVSVINRVGDTVSCTIRRKSTFNLQYTGPLKPNQYEHVFWDAFMYNSTADHIRINSITVDYTDGTSKTFSSGSFADMTK